MRGAALLGAVVGAGLGYFLPTYADTLGGGWGAWAVGAGGLALGLVVVRALAVRGTEGIGPALRLAVGPVLGALLAWAFWRFGPTWFGDLPDRLLRGAGLPNTWVAAAAAGGVLGLLPAALVDRNQPVTAGAAFGALPGAALGMLGGWSCGHWLVSVLAGAMVTMLVIRASAAALELRYRTGDAAHLVLLGLPFYAVMGAAVFWGFDALASHAAGWCDSLGAGSTVTSWVVAVLQFPGLLCTLIALPAGPLGGAGLVALGLLFVGTFAVVEHPGDIFLGALIGLADYFAGGVILSALFGTWQSGALTGAMVGAIIFTAARDAELARSIVIAAVAGAVAGALALWVDAAPLLGVGAGAVGGYYAVDVRVNFHQEMAPARLVLAAALVLAACTFQVAIASKGVRDGGAALALLKQGHDDRALDELTSAIDVNPHVAWTYRWRAEAARRLGLHEDAIEDLTHLIEEYPDDYAYYVARAEVHEDRGQRVDALLDLTRAIQRASDRSDLYVRRGWVHTRAGSEEDALLDFARALQRDSSNARAWHGTGWVHMYAGHPGEAHNAFNRAVVLEAAAENYFSRGWANLAEDRYTLAINDFTRALEREPDHARAFHGRGRAHLRRDEYAPAIRDFSMAISIDGRYADAYEGRGWSRLENGEQAAARRDFEKALKLDPGHAGARRGLLRTGGAAAAPPPRTYGSDKERLQGTWKVVQAQRLGETTHPQDGTEFTFSDDRVTVKDDQSTMTFSYRLDASRSPKLLAITFGTSATTNHSYRFQGDTLEMAYGAPGTPAPPRFTSQPGDTWLVVFLKRVR
jgi:uncharacterized protein (TIGR03067 family)